jgi:hypothetical protein
MQSRNKSFMHTIFEVSIQPTGGYLVNCHLSNHVFCHFGCLHLPMLNNQFKQSYKLRLNGVICSRILYLPEGVFQSANASASQQLIRTRYVQGPSTSEERGNRFSSPVNITKYQINIELWLLSM